MKRSCINCCFIENVGWNFYHCVQHKLLMNVYNVLEENECKEWDDGSGYLTPQLNKSILL
jgi:hypothetical protein